MLKLITTVISFLAISGVINFFAQEIIGPIYIHPLDLVLLISREEYDSYVNKEISLEYILITIGRYLFWGLIASFFAFALGGLTLKISEILVEEILIFF